MGKRRPGNRREDAPLASSFLPSSLELRPRVSRAHTRTTLLSRRLRGLPLLPRSGSVAQCSLRVEGPGGRKSRLEALQPVAWFPGDRDEHRSFGRRIRKERRAVDAPACRAGCVRVGWAGPDLGRFPRGFAGGPLLSIIMWCFAKQR